MPKPIRPTHIVISSPGEPDIWIDLPPAPKRTLLERVRWQLHCWHIGVRNLLFWLRGGR